MSEPYEQGPPRAAPAHFPYDHPNLAQVRAATPPCRVCGKVMLDGCNYGLCPC